jgi:hypothetical protein
MASIRVSATMTMIVMTDYDISMMLYLFHPWDTWIGWGIFSVGQGMHMNSVCLNLVPNAGLNVISALWAA